VEVTSIVASFSRNPASTASASEVISVFLAARFLWTQSAASSADWSWSRSSGSHLTFESRIGFPVRARRANLRDARWKIALRLVRRYSSAQNPGSRPQHGAEARLAG